LLSKYYINIENRFFVAYFCFLIFHPFFQGGQLTQFALMCGHPCSPDSKYEKVIRPGVTSTMKIVYYFSIIPE